LGVGVGNLAWGWFVAGEETYCARSGEVTFGYVTGEVGKENGAEVIVNEGLLALFKLSMSFISLGVNAQGWFWPCGRARLLKGKFKAGSIGEAFGD
jgi:hypothetical protein